MCGDPKTEVNPVRNFLVFDTPPELEGVPGTQTAYIDKFVVSEFGTRSDFSYLFFDFLDFLKKQSRLSKVLFLLDY